MVNLSLTNNEWYFLHCQIEKLSKQYSNNRVIDSIFIKLAENHPTLSDLKTDPFIMEYNSQWIGENNER